MSGQISNLWAASAPTVWANYVYFQDGACKLWRANIQDPSDSNQIGAFETRSTPCVPGDGYIYFQGMDNKLWQVEIDNPSNGKQIGSNGTRYSTASTPCVPGDGYIYFQGVDNKLWQVEINSPSNGKQIASNGTKYSTASTPCVPGDGYIYFQGVDNKLWQVEINNPSNGKQIASDGRKYSTVATPCVPGDGYIYFRGTDDTLWQVSLQAPSGTNRFSRWKTRSTPSVPGDGYVYFQGTDNKLWRVSEDGIVATNPGGLLTASSPCLPGDGNAYFQRYESFPPPPPALDVQRLWMEQVWTEYPPSDWMRYLMANNPIFKQSCLKQSVVPGTHDAAMYTLAGFPRSENARTQSQSIYDQLSGGVRYFDLRPALGGNELSGNVFYLYHGLVWGPALSDVVSDIQRFMQRQGCQEIVLLKFSHFWGFNDANDLIYRQFLAALNPLSPWYYSTSLPQGKRLSEIGLNLFVSDGHGKVLVFCDYQFQNSNNVNPAGVYVYRDGALSCPQENRSTDPTQGGLVVFDCYSDTDSYSQMYGDQLGKFTNYTGKCLDKSGKYANTPCDLYLLSWTLTPPLTSTPWECAIAANPNLTSAISKFGKNQYGQNVNIIFVDYYETSFVTDVCYNQNKQASLI